MLGPPLRGRQVGTASVDPVREGGGGGLRCVDEMSGRCGCFHPCEPRSKRPEGRDRAGPRPIDLRERGGARSRGLSPFAEGGARSLDLGLQGRSRGDWTSEPGVGLELGAFLPAARGEARSLGATLQLPSVGFEPRADGSLPVDQESRRPRRGEDRCKIRRRRRLQARSDGRPVQRGGGALVSPTPLARRRTAAGGGVGRPSLPGRRDGRTQPPPTTQPHTAAGGGTGRPSLPGLRGPPWAVQRPVVHKGRRVVPTRWEKRRRTGDKAAPTSPLVLSGAASSASAGGRPETRQRGESRAGPAPLGSGRQALRICGRRRRGRDASSTRPAPTTHGCHPSIRTALHSGRMGRGRGVMGG